MFEAYKIGIKVALMDNVSHRLSAMALKFASTDKEAKSLKGTLASIGKMTLAGSALVAGGTFALKVLDEPLEAAREWQLQAAKLRQMGIGDAQILDAQKFVTATDIIGTSMNERMRHFVEAQGSFRQSGMSPSEQLDAAKTMMPLLSVYEKASSVLDGGEDGKQHQSMLMLNKTVELLGGLKDTNRAIEIADGVFKATQSSGGMVNEQQLKQFVAYGSSAATNIQLREMFGGLEPVIGALGGSTSGMGLRTAYNRVTGGIALVPKKMQSEIAGLGIGDSTGTKLNPDFTKLMQTQPIEFARKMMEVYESHGIRDKADIEHENNILFGTNGAKVYNQIMSMMPVIEESMHAYDKAQGASQVLNDPKNQALTANMRFDAKVKDLQKIIGEDGGVLDMATKTMGVMGGALRLVTDFAQKHPTLTAFGTGLFAVTAAAAVAGGGILLLTASIKGLGLVSKATGVGTGSSVIGMAGKVGKGVGIGVGVAGLIDVWRTQKNAGKQDNGWGERLGSYGSSAAQGAMAGMAFGPWGAAIGAGIGLAYTAVVRNGGAIRQSLTGTGTWIETHIDRLKKKEDGFNKYIDAKMNELVDRSSKKWHEFSNHPLQSLAEMAKGYINNFTPVRWMYKGFSAVEKYLGHEMPANFTTWGGQLMDGLLNGIVGKAHKVIEYIKTLASDIGNAFTSHKDVDSHSPSRAFMRHGGFIVDGLVLGLNQNAHKAHAAIGNLTAQPRFNTIATGKNGSTHVHTSVNLDGRVVAQVVTKHQARDLNRPMSGGTRFDGFKAMPHPAMGY